MAANVDAMFFDDAVSWMFDLMARHGDVRDERTAWNDAHAPFMLQSCS